MLKHTLTTLDGLDPLIAKEYKKVGDVYVIDTDVTYEDVTPLKNSLVQERAAHKETKTAKTALETQVADLTTRAGTASEIETAWKTKLATKEAESTARETSLKQQMQTLLVDNVATQLAAEVTDSPELLIPYIRQRLAVSQGDDGKFTTGVLTADGKVSALSVKELAQEVVANKTFAPIIRASRASGGGAAGSKLPAGGKAFKDMTEADKTKLFHENPAKFREMAAAHKTALASGEPAPAAAT